MGGRLSHLCPMLVAAVFGLAPPLVGAAAGPVRLEFPVNAAQPFAMAGQDVAEWLDEGDQVYLLTGGVVLEQDGTRVEAAEAFIRRANTKAGQYIRFYAKGDPRRPVTVTRPGARAATHDAVTAEFTTPKIGRIHGKISPQQMADTPLYAEAAKAFGRPVEKPVILPVQAVQPPPLLPPPADPKTTLPPPPALDPPLLKGTTVIPVPLTEERTIWIAPRSTQPYEIRMTLINKERVTVITGGVKLLAKFATGAIRSLQIEADQIVIWKKDGDSKSAVDAMNSTTGSDSSGIEFYLSGNVVLRYGADDDTLVPGGPVTQSRTMRADRVYYDVENHRAICSNADLEFDREGMANKAHMRGQTIYQLGATEFQAVFAEIHASRLPSDPGLIVSMATASVYRMPRQQRQTIFGQPFRDRDTGELIEEDPTILEATDVTTRVEGIPVFYKSRVKTDINDPFGPFEGITFRQDNQFGFQTFVTWDMLDLIGLTKRSGENWDLLTDYLSDRGPALGTNYSLNSPTFLGMDAPFQTMVKAYAIQDKGMDRLGGERDNDYTPTKTRGRLLVRHQQEFGDLTVQGQLAYLSDRNFYEEYNFYDYNQGPNQETFLWLKYQTGNFAAGLLTQPNIRQGVSETQWLPKGEAHLIGLTPFDFLTYHTWGSAAYARQEIFRQQRFEFPLDTDTNQPPRERSIDTGRFDWMHELSMPINAGPAKIVPYGVADLAYYTNDVNGDSRGRAYGGLGVRASVPLSRLYRDLESELFNVQGLYHKNVFWTNYYYASSSTSYALLPQLDRLNDDATEAAYRNITPWHPYFEPTIGPDGEALASSPVYNPRLHAIRRLVDTKPDTLDDIHVLQAGWRQRFQTKRGYPGLEHEVDWLSVNVSGSFFPQEDQNFGHSVAFLESNVVWNVGDRNAVFLNSWVDPFDLGARYYALGTTYARDDRTSLHFAYRSIDPLGSRVVTAAATYVFNPKYAVTASTAYDFSSSNALSNSLTFTRIGTDLQVNVGFSYNALINNFGINLSVIPNLVASSLTNGNQNTLGGLGGNRYQDRR